MSAKERFKKELNEIEGKWNQVMEKYRIKPEYPWEKYPFYAMLRHPGSKWFGIVMNVSADKLGLGKKEEIDILVVKYLPDLIGGLRAEPGSFPAYHMNKEHWITILLDETADKKKAEQLIDLSFELTEKQFPFVWRIHSAQSAIRQRKMGVGKRMDARKGL